MPIDNFENTATEKEKANPRIVNHALSEVLQLVDGNDITPSGLCHFIGLDSLAELHRLSLVPERTLLDWFYHKPRLFEVVAIGAESLKKSIKNNTAE